MTTQDLSLLTDEERDRRNAAKTFSHLGVPSIEGGLANIALRFSDALIAARAENKRLREALNSLRKEHLIVEDCWYSCPKSGDEYCGENKGGECDCGADRYNAIIDAALLQSEKGGAE